MKRKMAYIGLSYLLGLFVSTFLNERQNIVLALCFVVFSSVHLAFFGRKSRVVVVLICIAFGIIYNIIYSLYIMSDVTFYENREAIFKGEIVDFKSVGNEKALYTIKGSFDNGAKSTIDVFYDEVECDYYDEVAISADFSRYEDDIFFESYGYNKAKGTFLKVDKVHEFTLTESKSFSFWRTILKFRDNVYQSINLILPNDEGKFLSAMLCGDTSQMPSQLKTTLYRSGIGHIFAVSGTHLIIISGILIFALQKLGTGKKLNFILVEFFVISFILFAGGTASVVRAGIMLTIITSGNLLKRHADVLNSLGICAIILTIGNPYVVRDASFLLSMSGVFGVGVLAPIFVKKASDRFKIIPPVKALIYSTAASICTLPFCVMFFNEFSLISPISNVILIPLCTFALSISVFIALLLIPSFLGLTFIVPLMNVIIYPLSAVAGLALKIVIIGSEHLVKIPFSFVPLGYRFISIAIGISIAFITIISLITRRVKYVALSISLCALMLVTTSLAFNIANLNTTKIAIITQGESSAIVIYKGEGGSVIDISGKGALSMPVSRFLSAKGIRNVDSLILLQSSVSSVSLYKNDLYVNPKITLGAEVDSQSGAFSDLKIGDTASSEYFTFSVIGDKNYRLTVGEKSIHISESQYLQQLQDDVALIYENGVQIFDQNGKSLDLTSEIGGAYLLSTDQELSVRRLDNAYRE